MGSPAGAPRGENRSSQGRHFLRQKSTSVQHKQVFKMLDVTKGASLNKTGNLWKLTQGPVMRL